MGSSEVTDCPKTYLVKDDLSHCEDVCKELGVVQNIQVSTVSRAAIEGFWGSRGFRYGVASL